MPVKFKTILFHKITLMLTSVLLITCVAVTVFALSPLQATQAASICGYSTSTPTLAEGSAGSSVKTLQSLLNEAYQSHLFPNSPSNFHPLLVVDGIFGANTLNAVIDFQTRYKIGVDGIVGPITWNTLINATAPDCTYLQ